MLRAVVVAFGCFSLGWACFYLYQMPLNHDVAWTLLASQKLLAGEQLYTDILEFNLPAIYWLFLIPAWLAKTFALPAGIVAKYFSALSFLLMLGFVVWRSAWLWRHWQPLYQGVAMGVLSLLWGAHLWPYLNLAMDTGQREYWVLLLLLPYLLRTMAFAVAQSRGQTVMPAGIGFRLFECLCLALAVAIKPQFVVVPALLEILLWWRYRDTAYFLRWQNWLAGALLVAYVAGILLFLPSYLDEIVPRTRIAYQAYLNRWDYIFGWHDILLMGVVVILAFARNSRYSAASQVLALAVVFSWLAYLLGQNAWPYHRIPFYGLSLLALLVMIPDYLQLWPRLYKPLLVVLCLVFVAMPVRHWEKYRMYDAEPQIVRHDEQTLEANLPGSILLFKQIPGQEALLVVFGMIPWMTAMVESGKEWFGHFPHQWAIPVADSVLNGVDDSVPVLFPVDATGFRVAPEAAENMLTWVGETIARDLARKPEVLLLEDSRGHGTMLRAGFRMWDFLETYAQVEKYLGDYRLAQRLCWMGNRFERKLDRDVSLKTCVRVYYRKDLPPVKLAEG